MSVNKYESNKIQILKKAQYPTQKVKMLMYLEAVDHDYLDVINYGPHVPTKLVAIKPIVPKHYIIKEENEWTLKK